MSQGRSKLRQIVAEIKLQMVIKEARSPAEFPSWGALNSHLSAGKLQESILGRGSRSNGERENFKKEKVVSYPIGRGRVLGRVWAAHAADKTQRAAAAAYPPLIPYQGCLHSCVLFSSPLPELLTLFSHSVRFSCWQETEKKYPSISQMRRLRRDACGFSSAAWDCSLSKVPSEIKHGVKEPHKHTSCTI